MPVFAFQNSQIEYEVWGGGSCVILAFPGYGKSASDFAVWKNKLENVTFVSVSLFAQGQSQWNEAHPFSKKSFYGLINGLLSHLGLGNEKIITLGYSIGARYALSAACLFSARVCGVILLAPDGLQSGLDFVKFASQRKRLKAFCIKNPVWVLQTLKFARILGILSEGAYRFYLRKFDTEDKRKKLFSTWADAAAVSLSPKEINTFLNKQNVPVCFFFGLQDKIIKPRVANRLTKKNPLAYVEKVRESHAIIHGGSSVYVNKALERILNSSQKERE